MTWLPQTARSDESSSGDLPVTTAVYRPSDQAATVQDVNWQYGYGYYGPRYYNYGYRYPSYGYSYRYPSYGYRYPSYSYRYPSYGYRYPSYGYRSYSYPYGGYRYGYRPGISFGFRF
jgi:hypothetical protein